jgi:hypothetical protein
MRGFEMHVVGMVDPAKAEELLAIEWAVVEFFADSYQRARLS